MIIELEKTVTQEMVDYLHALGNREVEPNQLNLGVCNNFDAEFMKHEALSYFIDFMKYPEFSGSSSYPIQCPDGEYKGTAYTAYQMIDDLWIGEYGQERLKFCVWCGDQMAIKLQEQTS